MRYLASGAIGVTITAKANTKTFLPDILDLKGKTIKYIDVCNNIVTTDVAGNTITNSPANVFLSLMQSDTKNYFIKNSPIQNYFLSDRKGVRDNIIRVVDFPNSYIDNYGSSDVNLFFVFWYDDPKIYNIYSDEQATNIEAFEVTQFNAVETKLYFDENRTLYDKQIQLFNVPFSIGGFTTPSGKTSVSTAVISDSFVTLQKNNFQFVRNVPLCCFINTGMFAQIKLQNVVFDFTNSYIEIPASLISSVTGKSYFFNVTYKQQ